MFHTFKNITGIVPLESPVTQPKSSHPYSTDSCLFIRHAVK